MLFDLVIAVICLYMSYSNISTLAEVPFADWQASQWLLALITLGLLVVGLYKAVRMVRAFIVAQKRAAAEAKRLQTKADAERRAEEDAGIDATLDE